MVKFTNFILIMLIFFSSCSSNLHKGIVKVEDLDTQIEVSDVDVKIEVTDEQIKELNPKIKEKVKKLETKLIKEIKLKTKIRMTKLKRSKLDKKNKLSRLTNLKQLGVIDITTRLSSKLYSRNTLSKDKYYVLRDNPKQDKFGGKLICNEEVLILRLDRSKLINCMNSEREKASFNWKTFLINYNFINVVDYKNHLVYPKCKLILAVSMSAYHNLSMCLINDKKLHGLFKYRNINSFGVNFELIKEN